MVTMTRILLPALIAFLLSALPARAQENRAEENAAQDAVTHETSQPAEAGPKSVRADVRESICLMIEASARAHELPVEFFARVIWQESRFHPGAVGPRTRSGENAQGLAQFMPRTAAERGLLDPFDPVQALPKSAEFLRELRDQFGNLGLAAAAYNAGPARVRGWLAGTRTLPAETRHYVAAITGIPADEWARAGNREPERMLPPNCKDMMALLQRGPNPYFERLQERVRLTADSPWGVQLSAGFSRDQALAVYSSIASRFEKVLSGRDPTILSSLLRSRGTRTFYQVRVGEQTRESANALCASIRRAGGACMVLRNKAG